MSNGNGVNPLKRAGSRLRSELRRKAFGRDVSAEVNDLQAAIGALHVAISDAMRDLTADVREALGQDQLHRTDLLVQRLDRKIEGLFSELSTREDLGTFFTGDAYADFDERFGGPGGSSAQYAELFRPVAGKGRVVDLSCRSGDVLAALGDVGVEAYGVARLERSVDAARARGFEVFQEGAVEHLARLGDNELAGAIALQVVEHLSPAGAEQLFVEAVRALAPGALFVLETPNPLSPRGLDRWVRDPTHRWPFHPETLRFVAERAGFAQVKVGFVGGDSKAAPDYALIAMRNRPAPPSEEPAG